ncbi:hypothetical protein B0H17DRAFT_921584 [Mycena rosella]|uniref:Uncharacterized protein n=1 Tax=Mycena rosella TaxID=1033263 RepID=A0AAD7GRV8_MYCRO|nr:hypothetical protein B0H17DRAFT_921584 [Mycena rosella]
MQRKEAAAAGNGDSDEVNYDRCSYSYKTRFTLSFALSFGFAAQRADNFRAQLITEEQKMEEGKRMFSIFAARMFEQGVLQAYHTGGKGRGT